MPRRWQVRAISRERLNELGGNVSSVIKPEPVAKDPLLDAVEKFPAKLMAAMKSLPAPVIAPRPSGAWIIDVSRDKEGKMSQMTAKFHETK